MAERLSTSFYDRNPSLCLTEYVSSKPVCLTGWLQAVEILGISGPFFYAQDKGNYKIKLTATV